MCNVRCLFSPHRRHDHDSFTIVMFLFLSWSWRSSLYGVCTTWRHVCQRNYIRGSGKQCGLRLNHLLKIYSLSAQATWFVGWSIDWSLMDTLANQLIFFHWLIDWYIDLVIRLRKPYSRKTAVASPCKHLYYSIVNHETSKCWSRLRFSDSFTF